MSMPVGLVIGIVLGSALILGLGVWGWRRRMGAAMGPPQPANAIVADNPPLSAVAPTLPAAATSEASDDNRSSAEDAGSRQCSRCGTSNRAAAQHCRSCGQMLVQEHPAVYLRDRSGRITPLGSRTTIGRAPNNTLVLNDPSVSEVHAEIVQQDRDFLLIDRGSGDGTYVNDYHSFRNRLKPGSIVRFGKVEWTFEMTNRDT